MDVYVRPAGLFDLATNNKSDTVRSLYLELGPTVVRRIATGTGTLNISDIVTMVMGGTSASTTPPVTISGNLGLTAGGRTFYVRDSLAPVDLDISAAIGNGTTMTKTFPGTLKLSSSANTYTGNTTVNEGLLVAGVDNPLPFGAGRGNLQLYTGPGHERLQRGAERAERPRPRLQQHGGQRADHADRGQQQPGLHVHGRHRRGSGDA